MVKIMKKTPSMVVEISVFGSEAHGNDKVLRVQVLVGGATLWSGPSQLCLPGATHLLERRIQKSNEGLHQQSYCVAPSSDQQMFQHHGEDMNTYRGDHLYLLALSLAQTLVEASADDVLEDLPGLLQLGR